MEKFIYRLALVNGTDIETILPYYFEDEDTALCFANVYAKVNDFNSSSLVEEYKHKKLNDNCNCCFAREHKCCRWYRFDFLYKDNRALHNRYLAITRISLY